MKIAVYGAGAIGAMLGARLGAAGHDVTLIARGAHLAAMRERGLHVKSAVFGEQRYDVKATESPEEVGEVDYVILGIKAQGIPGIAPRVASLLGPETSVLTTQNGLPWWYFHGVPGHDARLETVDPGGVIEQHIASERALGSIAYCSCSLEEPGVVKHTQFNRFPMGEPDGSHSERLRLLTEAFRDADFKAPIRNDIRHELWVKLLGNGAFNPLSVLTGKTIIEMIDYPLTNALIRSLMKEIRDTAAAAGVQIAFSIDKRIEGSRMTGAHKTSMLQDYEAGRSSEIDQIVGAIVELADRYNVPAPALKAIYAATQLRFENPLKHG